YHHRHVAELLDLALHLGDEALLVEGDLREQDDDRKRVIGRVGRPAGGGDPAGMAAHDLQHEHLRGSLRHGGDVEARLEGRHGDVLGHRAEARAVVGDRQVVVHGLGHVDGADRVAHGLGELRDLQARIGRVAAAVVEEVADVVGAEHLDQALVLGAVLVDALELVAARAEGARGRVLQGGDGRGRFAAGVDEILGERADDAVAAGVDLADAVAIGAGGLDDAGGAGVDHGGDPAGLGIEGVLLHMRLPFSDSPGALRPGALWLIAIRSGAGPEPGPVHSRPRRRMLLQNAENTNFFYCTATPTGAAMGRFCAPIEGIYPRAVRRALTPAGGAGRVAAAAGPASLAITLW